MKTTRLWDGVTIHNRSGRKIVVQWKQLPDGTRMALIMGDNTPQSVSGYDDEIGIFSAIMSAAPALFNMAKKVAPGLMSKAGKLVGNLLPGAAGKMLKGALAGPTKQAQRKIAQAGTRKALMPPKVAPASFAMPPKVKSVRHLASGAKVPAGYRTVTPVMKISDGAFVD
tara:strand:- start:1294 stop:1800 length:507 start_codon:yes stop_codon:yes gene_type:complete